MKFFLKGVMNLLELLIFLALGILFLILGWHIWKKEEITLIHSYHYSKVSEENKKDYTEQMGKSILLMGIGMILTGIIDCITETSYGWLFFTILLIFGTIKMIKAQKKYNNGIF